MVLRESLVVLDEFIEGNLTAVREDTSIVECLVDVVHRLEFFRK